MGWARERWSDPFFFSTLPLIASEGILAPDGIVWLPHLSCITDSLTEFYSYLNPYFEIELVEDAKTNPLFLATEDVEDELLRCPDSLINSNQIKPMMEQLDHTDRPFYALKLRKDFLRLPTTPEKTKTQRPSFRGANPTTIFFSQGESDLIIPSSSSLKKRKAVTTVVLQKFKK